MSFQYTHEKKLPYSEEFLFFLVQDVKNYSRFLPWIQKSVVYDEEHFCDHTGRFSADLTLSYAVWEKSYTSQVTWDKEKRTIRSISHQSPFCFLDNFWSFETVDTNTTSVRFHLAFEASSWALQKILTHLFNSITPQIMEAFEKEAQRQFRMNV